MARILTDKHRSDNTRIFVDEFDLNDFYLFVSSKERIEAVNSLWSKNDFLEKTIFGKKITKDDIFFLVKNYPWQKGTVYDQYDDRADLSDKRFYAVVYPRNNNTGGYRIYKCLSNNYGAPAENPPVYSETSQDQIYRTADGYIWKFMFHLTTLEFDRYNSVGYIPIIEGDIGANTFTSDTSSPINNIIVENPTENIGYEQINGRVEEIFANSIFISGTDLSRFENYYSGKYMYVTNTNGVSYVYTIDSYVYNVNTLRAEVSFLGGDPLNEINVGSTFKILPRIEIKGDGSGAIAIPKMSESSIVGVEVLEEGSGYTNVLAEVVDPIYFVPTDPNSEDKRAIIRPILSPRGGHGTNLIDELKCRHCLLFAGITETDNLVLPSTNEFTKIGIVKNPEFLNSPPVVFDNRISIEFDEAIPFVVNETVTQVNLENEVFFTAKVHEIQQEEVANTELQDASYTVFLSEFMGPYQNSNTNLSTISSDFALISSQAVPIEINNIIDEPEYIQRSGEVYFMYDFNAIERSEQSREEFKIVLEF